jgi:hypothetical protein
VSTGHAVTELEKDAPPVMSKQQLFRLLDQLAAGFEREDALSEDERAAKAAEILAWFRPLYTQFMAAAHERPCPIPWELLVQAGDEPHACRECINAIYDDWKRLRRRASILSPPTRQGGAA